MFMPKGKEPMKLTGAAKRMPPLFMAPKGAVMKGKGKKPTKKGYKS